MVRIEKRECMECGATFERDMDDPKVKKAYANMGVVADQCDACLRKWAKENR
jgi:hypothetical protein